jgi:hypothetical protein
MRVQAATKAPQFRAVFSQRDALKSFERADGLLDAGAVLAEFSERKWFIVEFIRPDGWTDAAAARGLSSCASRRRRIGTIAPRATKGSAIIISFPRIASAAPLSP